MSRQSTAAQRNLTLTEELEKLEQSITLTLQGEYPPSLWSRNQALTMVLEIDHNFSRAHRIVTTSVLPIVENYRENSNQVWEGSKFWKQFFEASANVSLSGYEEPPPEGSEVEGDEEEEEVTTTESAQATPSSASYASPPAAQTGEDDVTLTPNDNNHQYSTTSAAAAGAYSPSPTPKAHPSKQSKAPYSSPYSSLKRATLGASPSDSDAPSTPFAQKGSPSKPNPQQQQQQQQEPHQQSSPFAPPSTYRHPSHRTPSHNNDVLLHRVLDKTWRIQATPHSTARLPHRSTTTTAAEPSPAKPSTARKAARQQRQQQSLTENNNTLSAVHDDLDSSPPAPAPELHAEIFDTPARKGGGAGTTRVPGISVLTPAKGFGRTPAGKTMPGGAGGQGKGKGNLWDSDDDDEDFDDDGEGGGMRGMSPPKTIQFHVPQSRMVQTPGQCICPVHSISTQILPQSQGKLTLPPWITTAREASKKIVDDLLLTAGMMDDGLEGEDEGSPSIVKPSGGGGGFLEEDTF